jgi:hypothetical protein
MRKRFFFLLMATLGGAVGLASSIPVFAQSPSDNMAECQQLYGQWQKYNGTSSYSPTVAPNAALEECRKGNYTAGINDLKGILQHNAIPIPPPQTATAPRR